MYSENIAMVHRQAITNIDYRSGAHVSTMYQLRVPMNTSLEYCDCWQHGSRKVFFFLNSSGLPSAFYGLENEGLVSIFKSPCYEYKHVAIVTQNIPELLLTLLTLELSSMSSIPENCRLRSSL